MTRGAILCSEAGDEETGKEMGGVVGRFGELDEGEEGRLGHLL